MADRLAPAPPPLVGGRYEVRGPLGQGGMSAVYRAYDRLLEREVALKQVISADASAEREGRAAAPLTHPGFARTYDVVRDGDARYLVMELVQGQTLRELLSERGRLGAPLALDIAIRLCDALHHAHQAGVVHADVKPSNVVLDGTVQPKLVDFGISRRGDSSAQALGSPRYAAPEQRAGRAPDARTDVYQVGLLLAEMLGAPPSPAGQPPNVVQALPGLPRGLLAAVDRALHVDPGARYPSAAVFRDALEALRDEASEATGVLDVGPVAGPPQRADGRARDGEAPGPGRAVSPLTPSPAAHPSRAALSAGVYAEPAGPGVKIFRRPLRQPKESRGTAPTPAAEPPASGLPRWLTLRRVLPISALLTALLVALWFMTPQQQAPYCSRGASPRFEEGLAVLQQELGDTMGRPTECVRRDPESGDLQQATSRGLAYVRANSGRANFTNGSEHWAIQGNQLLYWVGDAVDPPRNAQASPLKAQSTKPAAKGR